MASIFGKIKEALFETPEGKSPRLGPEKHERVNVLVVGSQNTGRSAFIYRLIQSELPDLVEVSSAGFFSADGDPCSHHLEQGALKFAIDLSGHRAQSLTHKMVKDAEYILVMDQAQKESLASTFKRTEGVYLIAEFLPEEAAFTVGNSLVARNSDVPNCGFADAETTKTMLTGLQKATHVFCKIVRRRHNVPTSAATVAGSS